MTVKLSDQPQLDSLDSVPATCSLPTKWRIIPTMERPDIIGGLLDCSVVDESKAGRESGEREWSEFSCGVEGLYVQYPDTDPPQYRRTPGSNHQTECDILYVIL